MIRVIKVVGDMPHLSCLICGKGVESGQVIAALDQGPKVFVNQSLCWHRCCLTEFLYAKYSQEEEKVVPEVLARQIAKVQDRGDKLVRLALDA